MWMVLFFNLKEKILLGKSEVIYILINYLRKNDIKNKMKQELAR